MKIDKSRKTWAEAKKLIPGGTQLLSKRPEMFLPENWPAYYTKAKGVTIEDIDGNSFIDMTIMGVGSCILGYADKDVNSAVMKAVRDGSMCTLNAPEEVELAKLLIEIHPWADQVRYARTGGEAMAIAVRLARAASGKEKVAFCGYHGWHDWYLSVNIGESDGLSGHLLPGLSPVGIPAALRDTTFPFEYNNISQLRDIVSKHNIGAIVLEPLRHQEPRDGFIRKVRQIASKAGAVLVFDEITSGWRNNLGGVHLEFGVNPDIAVFAKAIGNGYPMAAVIGKKKVMKAAHDTFISSTYWTERIGPSAALATVKKIRALRTYEHIAAIGKMIGEGWSRIAGEHGIDISVVGPYSLVTFSFKHSNPLELKTLFTQEMLKRGFLASTSVYVTYSHKKSHVARYLKAVEEVFAIIGKSIRMNNTRKLLEGPVCHSGFKRLT